MHAGGLANELELRAGLGDAGVQTRPRLGDGGPEIDRGESLARPPHSTEGQQISDQPLHPLRPVDREGDVLLAALVQLAAVTLLEQLAEARHLAQRLLEVVRGDIGELLEVGVRPGQLGGPALEVSLLGLDLGNGPYELEPHGLHTLAHLPDIRRTTGFDREIVGAVRDRRDLLRQFPHRLQDRPLQGALKTDERRGNDHRHEAEDHDHELGGRGRRLAAPRPPRGTAPGPAPRWPCAPGRTAAGRTGSSWLRFRPRRP